MKTINTLIAAAAFIGAVSATTAAFAVDEYNVSTGTTVRGPASVRGNDVIALATDLDVTPGHAKFTQVHDGVAYYFSSDETRKQFEADPERYMPQYGGFCAFGVALGKKLDAAPRFADIVDGKLYVFLNAAEIQGRQTRNACQGRGELAGDAPRGRGRGQWLDDEVHGVSLTEFRRQRHQPAA